MNLHDIDDLILLFRALGKNTHARITEKFHRRATFMKYLLLIRVMIQILSFFGIFNGSIINMRL